MSWLIQIEQYKNISIAKSHYRKLAKKKETNTLTLQFYNKRLLDNKHKRFQYTTPVFCQSWAFNCGTLYVFRRWVENNIQ